MQSLRIAALAAALTVPAPGYAEAGDGGPRLVLVLVVDQLRRDRVDAELPGGIGRLVREGRSFSEGSLAHAMTETCPGHATVLTGLYPATAGIPGNSYVDVEAGRRVYCVADASPDATVLGGEEGRSPRTLRGDALGDWMKAADARSRVFSVGGKDRSAIMLGGQRPDGAFWYRSGDPPRFTTSRYYAEALPAWVEAWNGEDPLEDGFLAALPEEWTHASEGPPRIDAYPGESTIASNASPHPLRDDDAETTGSQLYATPYLDELTLDFARRLVAEENLGTGPAPDLLALGLSATDVVGHMYGPFSRESHVALERLDASLGDFMAFLEGRVGAGRLLVALTSDHGVLPLPEWLAERGEASCPEPGGRVGVQSFGFSLLRHLHFELSPFSWPRSWIAIAGTQIGVSRRRARDQGVAVETAAATAKAWLEEQSVIERVWTPEEIASEEGELAELYRRSFVPDRSGDLVVQIHRGCLVSPFDAGTSHGSPFDYDRDVPVVFFGHGVAPGVTAGPAASVDMGPTLAALLGVPTPDGLDGKALLGTPSE